MGRTTIFIDEKLIDEARRLTKLKTKREVIEEGDALQVAPVARLV